MVGAAAAKKQAMTMMEDRRDLGSMSSALMMPTAMAQKMTVRANPEASSRPRIMPPMANPMSIPVNVPPVRSIQRRATRLASPVFSMASPKMAAPKVVQMSTVVHGPSTTSGGAMLVSR